MERHIDKRLDAMDQRLDAMDQRFDAMDAKIEKVETTLLSEFHKWASPLESRLPTHRSWFQEVDAEMVLLKARLTKLETRQQ